MGYDYLSQGACDKKRRRLESSITNLKLVTLSRPSRSMATSLRSIRRLQAAGFTLVELLVALVIMGLLMSLTLVGISAAREASRRVTCTNNLREIGLGTRMYVNTYGKYPKAWAADNRRWMDLLKPFFPKQSGVYRCPSDVKQIAVAWDPEIILSYGINSFNFLDQRHCFWYGVADVCVKSPPNIILFADCTPGKYYCGGGNTFREPVPDVSYRHSGGRFNAVFCDGHVESRLDTTQKDWDAAQ